MAIRRVVVPRHRIRIAAVVRMTVHRGGRIAWRAGVPTGHMGRRARRACTVRHQGQAEHDPQQERDEIHVVTLPRGIRAERGGG